MNFISIQITNLLLLAQGEAAEPVEVVKPQAGADNPLLQMMPLLIGFMVLYYFIIIRPQQKDMKRRQDQLESLKKNDKVVTGSGIIGTIASFSEDGRFVTLKVDDTTRIKFTRDSIRGSLAEPEPESEPKKS